MKQHQDPKLSQSNLLNALQQNKLIQDKSYDVQQTIQTEFNKRMNAHKMTEKFNRQVLYLCRKEAYIRHLRRSIEKYDIEQQDGPDEHYISLVSNVKKIMTGEQTLVIPPTEEEYRSAIQNRYKQFIQENRPPPPLVKHFQKPAPTINQSLNIDLHGSHDDFTLRGLEETWKNIHAKSAVERKRKPVHTFPRMNRAYTARDSRLNQSTSSRSLNQTMPLTSTTQRSQLNSDSRSFTESISLGEEVEIFLQHMDSLQKNIDTDLVLMKSIRRDKENPNDMKMIYESRRKIAEINRHALDIESADRKSRSEILRSSRRLRLATARQAKKDSPDNDQNQDTSKQPTDKVLS